MNEFEFYPLRFYRRDRLWRIYVCELTNLNRGASWHLLGFGWDKDGFVMTWGGAN
jgi:hypothetical protein